MWVAQVVARRFLHPDGKFYHDLERYFEGELMSGLLFQEAAGYALALTAMQRLESRHHIISMRAAASRRKGVPQLSADMRRRQNKDIEDPVFQTNFSSYISRLNELALGPWNSLTELYDGITKRFSSSIVHLPFTNEDKKLERFKQQLIDARGPALHVLPSGEGSLWRAHVAAALQPNAYFAFPKEGCDQFWVFQLLCHNPGEKMYIQRASYLSIDDPQLSIWLCFLETPNETSQLFSGVFPLSFCGCQTKCSLPQKGFPFCPEQLRTLTWCPYHPRSGKTL